MAEHVWTVLCQATLADTTTGVISLIELLEKLILHPKTEVPDIADHITSLQEEGQKGVLLPVKLQLVSRWMRSEEETPEASEARVSVLNPNGEALFVQVVPIDLVENTGQRLTLSFDALPVTGLGRYWFVVEQHPPKAKKRDAWTVATKIPLEVVQAESA